MEAITRSGTDIPSSRPTGPFSPNVGEEEFCELRLLGILGSSLSAYRASTGPGYPSGCPGPTVANILRRGGRPEEVRHSPDNKGVGCRGGDNLALDALPTVPLYEANRGGSAARSVVDVARCARPTAVLLRPRPGLSGSGLYSVLGRALWMDLPLARLSLCAPSALRRSVGGETMATPGGVSTPWKACQQSPQVLGVPASIMGSEFPPTRLRPFTLPHPDALISPLC